MNPTITTRPLRYEDVDEWQIETDLAIVGFGGAGACAAIEAADAGAEVVLFEVASASGGSTALSSAEIYMGGGGGTRVQRACGYQDTTTDMFNYLMAAQGDLADEERIRLYCDGSLEHFDWLVELGVPYKDTELKRRAMMALTDDCLLYTGNEKAWPFRELATPCPRGHNLEIEGDHGGPLFMDILTKGVESRGVRIEYDARALTLIADSSGEIRGVMVRIDGKPNHVRARKGVLLSAGGFIMNRDMMALFAPKIGRLAHPIGNPFDDGSGIRMGEAAGGALMNMNQCFLTIPYYPPSSLTFGILVNAQGQRFINEDVYHARIASHIQKQVGDRIYLIIGEKHWKEPNMLGGKIAGTGDTFEEVAEEIGLPVENFSHTLRHYNAHAAKGEDPLFHKQAEWLEPIEPTIAAIDITPGRNGNYVAFTLGGLVTRPTGEVLRLNGDVIPGLYAAGRTTCGLPRRPEGYASGLSVGDVTFFGRLAGRKAAGRKSSGDSVRQDAK